MFCRRHAAAAAATAQHEFSRVKSCRDAARRRLAYAIFRRLEAAKQRTFIYCAIDASASVVKMPPA